MHINMSYRARAAWVSAGFAGVLGMGCPVCAEPIGATSWSDGVEIPDAEASDVEGRQNRATGAPSQQELLIRARQWHLANTGQTEGGQGERLLFQTDAQAMASAVLTATAPIANEDAQWHRELADTVLDAVRPVYEGLASFGILDAVRSVESELGLDKVWSVNDSFSGDYFQYAGIGLHPDSVSWAGPGNRSDSFSRPRSAGQIADDQRNAALLMEQLIEEIKPWVFTLVALYVLGYMVKFSLDYVQWRAARRRKRSAMGAGHTGRKRHRRHRRRPTV